MRWVTLTLFAFTILATDLDAQTRSGSESGGARGDFSTSLLTPSLFNGEVVDADMFQMFHDDLKTSQRETIERIAADARASMGEAFERDYREFEALKDLGFTLNTSFPGFLAHESHPHLLFELRSAQQDILDQLDRKLEDAPIVVDLSGIHESNQAVRDNSAASGVDILALPPEADAISQVLSNNKDRLVIFIAHTPKQAELEVVSNLDETAKLSWKELVDQLPPIDRERVLLHSCHSTCVAGSRSGLLGQFNVFSLERTLTELAGTKTLSDVYAALAADEQPYILRGDFTADLLVGSIIGDDRKVTVNIVLPIPTSIQPVSNPDQGCDEASPEGCNDPRVERAIVEPHHVLRSMTIYSAHLNDLNKRPNWMNRTICALALHRAQPIFINETVVNTALCLGRDEKIRRVLSDTCLAILSNKSPLSLNGFNAERAYRDFLPRSLDEWLDYHVYSPTIGLGLDPYESGRKDPIPQGLHLALGQSVVEAERFVRGCYEGFSNFIFSSSDPAGYVEQRNSYRQSKRTSDNFAWIFIICFFVFLGLKDLYYESKSK